MSAEELRAIRKETNTDISYLPLTEEIKNRYLQEAAGRADEILHMPSIYPTTIQGNCWYVSNDGSDANDGSSEETPWRTCGKLIKAQEEGMVRRGDGVFFRRGDVWDAQYPAGWGGDYALRIISGVTYSAYGYGDKPLFRNCLCADGPESWQKTEYENVWVYTGDAGERHADVGAIILDNGRAYGIKVSPKEPNDPYNPNVRTMNSGMVTNGIHTFHSGDTFFTNPGCLANELEFFHDYAEHKLYLYWSAGNPGESFHEIRLVRRGNVVRGDTESSDIVIDNLAVKFGGAHGINVTNAKNVTIQNCIFGWIGGSFQELEGTTRYGNAVENWGDCDGFFIRNCIVYQCYDAGLTTQHVRLDPKNPLIMNNVDFSDNVMAYSNSPLEIWCGNSAEYPMVNRVTNTRMNNNYCLYSGYHFGHQRPLKNGSFGCLGGKSPYQVFLNTEMCGNKFLFVSAFAFYSRCIKMGDSDKGIYTNHNVYMIGDDRSLMKSSTDPVHGLGEGRLYRFDYETLSTIASLGMDADSTFYYYKGNLYPEEDQGVYLYQ